MRDLTLIEDLISNGGPKPEEYACLDQAIQNYSKSASAESVGQLRNLFGEAFSEETMQGFAYQKPHGYAGDFEIIDRIYLNYRSSKAHLRRWDEYWQQHDAARAVRNRKDYFHALLDDLVLKAEGKPIRVLKIATGPGRSMYEWMCKHPDIDVQFDCVEICPKAIAYADRLNEPHKNKVTFIEKNALRFRSDKQYDLVWSAGLFDYFNDKIFMHLLKRLTKNVKSGGQLVVGNFSLDNSSRSYMEIFDWVLNHRSEEQLLDLASRSESNHYHVSKEPLGVNLFLHLET